MRCRPSVRRRRFARPSAALGRVHPHIRNVRRNGREFDAEHMRKAHQWNVVVEARGGLRRREHDCRHRRILARVARAPDEPAAPRVAPIAFSGTAKRAKWMMSPAPCSTISRIVLPARSCPAHCGCAKIRPLGEMRLLHPAEFVLRPSFAQAPLGQQQERVVAMRARIRQLPAGAFPVYVDAASILPDRDQRESGVDHAERRRRPAPTPVRAACSSTAQRLVVPPLIDSRDTEVDPELRILGRQGNRPPQPSSALGVITSARACIARCPRRPAHGRARCRSARSKLAIASAIALQALQNRAQPEMRATLSGSSAIALRAYGSASSASPSSCHDHARLR